VRSTPFVAIIVTCALIGCSGSRNEASTVPSIAPADALKFLGRDSSVVFLDVRSNEEFTSETGHLEGAILVPVDSLENRTAQLEPYKSKTIIAYCRSGVRSSRAQRILAGKGFHALSMLGGITRWNKEQLPVVKESH